jgi:hypothetical protein
MLNGMLILRMRRCPLSRTDPALCDSFLEELQATMQPLIRPTRELQAAQLGVDVDFLTWGSRRIDPLRDSFSNRRKRPTWTEIFVLEAGLLVIIIRSTSGPVNMVENPDGSTEERASDEIVFSLHVNAIMSTTAEANYILDTVSAVAKSIFDVEMVDFYYRSERFDSISSEVVAEDLPRADIDIKAAKALASRPARTLAIAIKSSRGLLVKDIGKITNTAHAAELVKKLVSGGVAVNDVVVVCGVSQAQVALVPDRDSLVKLKEDGLRCPCGKPIDQESAEDLLTITDLGALLLDKSRWLSVLVREELVNLGVRHDDILLECQLGADEVDCIALISGNVTIFELKDKEFNMGNAYSFSAKISVINPERSVILTTDKVANDVKGRFSRVKRDTRGARPARYSEEGSSIEYIEGDDFRSGLQRVIYGIYKPDASQILDSALQQSVPEASSILAATASLEEPIALPTPEKPSKGERSPRSQKATSRPAKETNGA